MKQKTALAQAIEDLQKTKKSVSSKNQYAEGYLGALDDVINVLENLKPIERQQIENSYLVGLVDSHCKGASSKDYFNQNLTQD
jgi:hypothetical protein